MIYTYIHTPIHYNLHTFILYHDFLNLVFSAVSTTVALMQYHRPTLVGLHNQE